MRLRASVIEGDQTRTAMVPLISIMEFNDVHGRTVNSCIPVISPTGEVIEAGADFVEWEPWLCWHTATKRLDEGRDFDAWLADIEWAQVSLVESEPDPSGGGESRTGTSSPASSSPASSTRSSRSTSPSKRPSGKRQAAKP